MTAIQRVMTTTFAAACLLVSGSTTIHGGDLRPDVYQQLAGGRAAPANYDHSKADSPAFPHHPPPPPPPTATYHDVNEALADGYIGLGMNPGEGDAFEFVNFGLVDCTLDPLHPEALRYVASGNGLRLVAVEYSIPMDCAATPPEDFLPGVGEWEQEPGVPVWTLAAWIWTGEPE
jgi:hypothetical protein